MYREANSQQLSKQEILSFSTQFGCSRQLHRNPPGSEYTLPGVSVFSECQAAGSIKFCADGGSTDRTRTRRRFVRKIKPPLQQHKQAIGKSNEKVNMHDCPDYPRCETRKPAEAQVGDGVCSADDREITLIPIPERFRLCTPRHTAPNDIRNVLTFLYSGLSYSGHEHRRS